MSTTVRLDRAPRPADALRDRCTLTVMEGANQGVVHAVGPNGVTIGRSLDAGCVLDDLGVSGEHARIELSPEGFVVHDLGSTNGTYLRQERITRPRLLEDGDRLVLGEGTVIRISLHDHLEQQAAERMYEAAVRDPLTGAYNRGYLEDRLPSELAFAQRHGVPLAVIFIDLDYFSAVNNNYGHQAGDLTLQAAARAMADSIRAEDLMCRYGGEEFVVVAREIPLDHALILAERLRATLMRLSIPWGEVPIRITASFGVACYDRSEAPYGDASELVAAADRAVYRAKRDGRNRVCAASRAHRRH